MIFRKISPKSKKKSSYFLFRIPLSFTFPHLDTEIDVLQISHIVLRNNVLRNNVLRMRHVNKEKVHFGHTVLLRRCPYRQKLH